MSDFSSERPLDVSGTKVLFGIGTALPGSVLLSIWREGGSEGWWDAATGAVLILLAVILLVHTDCHVRTLVDYPAAIAGVRPGILGALLVPGGSIRFVTACVWVGLMSNVWVTLRQPVRI